MVKLEIMLSEYKLLNENSIHSVRNLRELITDKLALRFGCAPGEATVRQIYETVNLVVLDILSEKRHVFTHEVTAREAKQVFYMSMEFLVGRSLRNNLSNLKIEKEFDDCMQELGFDLKKIYEMEPDAGLGNGGLGRLAACYLDSLTSLGYPAMGFSIRYEFGIFRQKIVDGWQMELPDDWLDAGNMMLIRRTDETVEVHFEGRVDEQWGENGLHPVHKDYYTVLAVPYDMLISGYDSGCVNTLRLWSAKSVSKIDMSLFSRGEYARSVEQNAIAESISKVLYPSDNHPDGKSLRLKQQYFFVCASLQNITKKHFGKYGTLDNLPEKAVIHINDTHPALCVPELLRVLIDEYRYSWEKAWDITTRTLAYTNHTVMPEALETWPVSIFSRLLPRIYSIVVEINRRFCDTLYKTFPDAWSRIPGMAVLNNENIFMANLCLAACFSVNSVSKLHLEIIKKRVFKDFYDIYPEKFKNVTNGIAHRRWLCQSNPLLAQMIGELIGGDYITMPEKLVMLADYADDTGVLDRLAEIKLSNKKRLACYIADFNGINTDPHSVFDVHVKRMHEYKRQLMNALHILHLYFEIKEKGATIYPRTFIFAAKASPGYYYAKEVIRFICALADMINKDAAIREYLRVVFLEDYRVTLAELIIPAAEISEQISLAGKEASGTGNMKLMINGAVTLGTLDGANVEIFDTIGAENMLLFGMTAREAEELMKSGYNPNDFYNRNPYIKRVIDALRTGIDGKQFGLIADSLLCCSNPDPFMNLADFESYVNIHKKAEALYRNRKDWNRMALANIAGAGIFAADRSIREYAANIWDLKPVKI